MSNEEHIILCGVIELVMAIIDLMTKNYIAWWILFGLAVATITFGIVLERKRKKKDE
jgi:Flp pilus assembly protein TadB